MSDVHHRAPQAQETDDKREQTVRPRHDMAEASPPCVLVVDDDEGTRDTFRIALRLECIHVEIAADGAGAIAATSAARFDLALIDWRLPDMSGNDVARRLVTSKTPFVLMSAFLTTPVVVEAMRLGAIDVLDKPIDVRELSGIVRSAIRGCSPRGVSQKLDAVLRSVDVASSDGVRR